MNRKSALRVMVMEGMAMAPKGFTLCGFGVIKGRHVEKSNGRAIPLTSILWTSKLSTKPPLLFL